MINNLAFVIDFGPTPQGTGGAAPPPPTGTDYIAHDPPILAGLTHQFIDFGFRPQGSGGAVIVKPAVGGFGRRIRRDEFERRLKEQRDNTFGRRRFAELQALWAAEETASRLALETKSKAQRKALEAATQAARDAARSAEDASAVPVAQIDALTLALQAASSAARIKTSLDEAKAAERFAAAVIAAIRQAEEDNDEEEAIALLLMH